MQKAPKNNKKENKPQPSLIPMDILIELLEPAYREGLEKYSRESWRLGFNISDMQDALERHITAFYYKSIDYDAETLKTYGIHKHHLGAAIFCIIAMYNSLNVNSELDDRPLKLLAKMKKPELDKIAQALINDQDWKEINQDKTNS